LLKFRHNKSKNYTKGKRLPPGPWKLPVIGNLLHVVAAAPGVLPHYTLRNLARKHGPLMHLQLGQYSSIVVSSARMAKEVMKTHDVSLADRPIILASEIVGYNGMGIGISPYGDYWRQMRKISNMELLSTQKVLSFRSIREDEVRNLITSIHSSMESGLPVDLSEKLFSLTNNIICRTTFGYKCKDQEFLIKIIKELISLTSDFDVADLFPSFKFLHAMSRTRPRLEKLHKSLDQIFDDIINKHAEQIDAGFNAGDRREDLVDVLIRLKSRSSPEFPITNDNIKAVILDLFLAGTETSSTTIEWAMAEMMRNPRVMEKAQAVLREGLEGKDVINESDIKALGSDYLKLVIKETLRLHPPLPLLVPRECREECEIGGYSIPMGTKVITNAWAIGRDSEYWEDADSFIPERFENSSIDYLGSNYEYIPFGGGRRMCPGITFGLVTIEFALAKLLYHFDWSPPRTGMTLGDVEFGGYLKMRNNLYLLAIPPPSPHS
jgi:cytochrome P450